MAEGEGGGGGGGKLKLIIIIVVLLLLIGGAAGAAFLFLGGGGEEEAAPAPANVKGTGGKRVENPVFLPVGTFIVNLADGRRYLKTNLELMLSEELAKNYLNTRIAEVKDIIVAELQTLHTEQLRDPGEREQLKQRLLSKVERLLPTKEREWEDPKPLKKVLITEFYLQ